MIEIAIVSGGDLLLESRRIIKSEFRMNTKQLFNNQTITLKRTVLMSMMAMSLGASACLPGTNSSSVNQQEIEQLRQEVQALRALIEQQQTQTAAVTACSDNAGTCKYSSSPCEQTCDENCQWGRV